MQPKASQIINSLLSTCLLLSRICYTSGSSESLPFCKPASSNYTEGSPYQSNLKIALAYLVSDIPSNNFYTRIVGESPDTVYGLLQCRYDIRYEDCKICGNSSKSEITEYCRNDKEATLFSENCVLRYADYLFFSIPSISSDSLLYLVNPNNISNPNPDSFDNAVEGLLNNISKKAAYDASKFSLGTTPFNDSVTIFGMVQCIRALSQNDCSKCLEVAVADLSSCCKGRRGGRVRANDCDFRYEIYPFSDSFILPSPPPSVSDPPTTKPEPTDKKKQNVSLIVIIVVATVLMLVITIFFLWRKVMKKRVEAFKEFNNTESELISTESLIFDLATLRVATNHFSDSHKLGEGGFGSVYKGELPDGRKIAVKRLARHSGQGLEQLKTEVTLVAKLMHKNLVQLLGFCIREEEKLLIYEFLPNGSLDQILYDESKRPLLNWEKRYKIILGIASGVLYLHQDSHDKIVHRDLKASNILLDEDMTAKISDFGLARLFGKSQVEDNTNHIAGTYGYMAPEYTMHGKYSTKSDVFSFGVLVLEIVSGRKSSGFHNSMNLLSYVWHYWNGGMALDIVDPTLSNQWLPSEILKCLQLGLLCVQQEPHRRPNMTQIFLWLNNYTVTCPVPSPPAFFVSVDEVTAESMNEVTVSDINPR